MSNNVRCSLYNSDFNLRRNDSKLPCCNNKTVSQTQSQRLLDGTFNCNFCCINLTFIYSVMIKMGRTFLLQTP